MKHRSLAVPAALALASFAALADTAPTPAPTHRYIVERTFPAHALDGITPDAKKQVNAANGSVGVRWVESFANADKSKTYCVYEGPDEAAIRKAAELNHMTVDHLTEVPTTTTTVPGEPQAGAHRYVVRKTFADPASALADAQRAQADAPVRRLTSFLSLDQKSAYTIYEGPDETAVRNSAKSAGASLDFVAEVPALLLPN